MCLSGDDSVCPHLGGYPGQDQVRGVPLPGPARGYPNEGYPDQGTHLRYPFEPGQGVPHLGYPPLDLARGYPNGGYPTSGTPPVRPGSSST